MADGLDMGLCFINKDRDLLKYAGAKIDLIVFKNNEMSKIKSNSQSIGYKRSRTDYHYINHEFPIDNNETFYLYSDGITDQTGGPKNYPFSKLKFNKLLASLQMQPLHKQSEIILDTINQYQGNNLRCDDMTVLGFKTG